MRAHSWILPASILFTACSGPSEVVTPAPFPLPVDGGFSASLDTNRLTIASGDGRVLLDGLPPAAVNGTDPPLVGFATRDATTAYTMEVGAFEPMVTVNGPWRVTERFAVAADGSLQLLDRSGALLASIAFSAPASGHLVATVSPGDGPERQLSWGFACDNDDHFAGFGAQSMDVDHLGFTVPTWVQEHGIGKEENDSIGQQWPIMGTRHASLAPIPQFLARRGYVLTADSSLRSTFALCSESPTAARVQIEMPSSIHLFDGPAPADALQRASELAGRPRMPPAVAFAPWLDAIYGQQSVLSVAQKLRAAGVPTSVIWTEDWRGGIQVGDSYSLQEEWEVDPTLYPDVLGMSNQLHAQGFDFFVYFNSFVYEGSKAWPETAPNGWLVQNPDGTPYTFLGAKGSDTGLLDLYNPQARAWAVGKMQDAIALGADGWMNDFAEWLPTDAVTAAGPSLPLHNTYPVAWQETARQAIDGVQDGEERLFFGRSAWIGSPPLADVIWAGDQLTEFDPNDGIASILPIGIGLGIGGISTYGHDIGGYQSDTCPDSTKELFFRWTELGAWSPVMRTHHGTHPLKEWNWQSDADTTAHFVRYARQHMALVPYLQGLASYASQTGLPMWRGLMVGFPADATAWGIKDEVLLGPSLLVAPVVTQGVSARDVYLPAGTWYPWSGGPATAGPATISAAAPVAEIPVFAAAGALIPTYPDGVMTLVHGSAAVPDASSVGDSRILYAFLGADGSFFETGGLGYQLAHQGDASGTLAAQWNGLPVPACDASQTPPCLASTADGATAYVVGSGELDVTSNGAPAAKLTAPGGLPDRKLTWVLRR